MGRLPLLLAASLLLSLTGCGDDGDGGFRTDAAVTGTPDFAYVIPEGAGEAFDAGQPLEVLPARLEATVGDVIEIRNDDRRGHLIGPFYVGAEETLRQRFATRGEFIGNCTVHPSGEIVVVVT